MSLQKRVLTPSAVRDFKTLNCNHNFYINKLHFSCKGSLIRLSYFCNFQLFFNFQ